MIIKLSQRAQELFDRFDSAALQWGYTRDEGYGNMVDEDEKEYAEAKRQLLEFLSELQV